MKFIYVQHKPLFYCGPSISMFVGAFIPKQRKQKIMLKFAQYKLIPNQICIIYISETMLSKMIQKGFDLAKNYPHFPKTPCHFDFYEADFKAFNPTQQAQSLLHGQGKLVYNVQFEKMTNGTFFTYYKNGLISGEQFIHSLYVGDQAIRDYSTLTVEEAMKIFLEKYPNKMVSILNLRKPLYPGVMIPSYFLTTQANEHYEVDFLGHVKPVE